MLHLCVHVNGALYMDDRPLVLTAGHSKGRRFTVSFYWVSYSPYIIEMHAYEVVPWTVSPDQCVLDRQH